MRRSWLFSLTVSSLVGALVVAVTLAGGQTGHGEQLAATAAAQSAAMTDEGDQDGKREGQGPPPWAQSLKGRSDHSWKKAWHALSPAQRQQKMADLAKAHAQGMRKWGRCVAAARKDASTRARCEKPMPPGLAKRLH